MNEQNNVTLIQKVYAAFGKGDIQTILDYLTPDVDWSVAGPTTIPFAGDRRGPGEVKGFFDALATTQDNQRLTIDEIIAQGDQVASIGRYSCTIKATGKQVDSPVAHFFTVRDGRISKFVDFLDTALVVEGYDAAKTAAVR